VTVVRLYDGEVDSASPSLARGQAETRAFGRVSACSDGRRAGGRGRRCSQPQMLFLGGDQIHADDVTAALPPQNQIARSHRTPRRVRPKRSATSLANVLIWGISSWDGEAPDFDQRRADDSATTGVTVLDDPARAELA
jgi:hypothetical protein